MHSYYQYRVDCILFNWSAGHSRTQNTSNISSEAKNVTAGPEDSGVEVGQESEQENTSGKEVKSAIDVGNSVDNLPDEKQNQDLPGPASRSHTEHIVFGGKSIVEGHDNENKKSKPAR